MAKPTTKIAPLDPAFHGESNYEVGLEDLLTERRNLIAKLEADRQTSQETLQSAREALQVVEGLWQNYTPERHRFDIRYRAGRQNASLSGSELFQWAPWPIAASSSRD